MARSKKKRHKRRVPALAGVTVTKPLAPRGTTRHTSGMAKRRRSKGKRKSNPHRHHKGRKHRTHRRRRRNPMSPLAQVIGGALVGIVASVGADIGVAMLAPTLTQTAKDVGKLVAGVGGGALLVKSHPYAAVGLATGLALGPAEDLVGNLMLKASGVQQTQTPQGLIANGRPRQDPFRIGMTMRGPRAIGLPYEDNGRTATQRRKNIEMAQRAGF